MRVASHVSNTDAASREIFTAAGRLQIRERIYDVAGNQWTDVSAWYWSATTGKSQGPWWAITTASAVSKDDRITPSEAE